MVALLLAGCAGHGGKGGETPGAAKPAVDADPYALLPPAAVAIVRVDARAAFTNPTLGASLGAIADSLVPLGDDAGLRLSRDLDRVIAASYATSAGDVAAVLSGRFDVDKIAHATKTKAGAAVAAEPHGAYTLYHAGRAAWSPLTATTLLAGSPEGVRDALDRIARGPLDRWEPAWMTATLETPTATAAAVGDFASRPLAAAALGAIQLPWVAALHQVRALGTLKPDALDVSGTLTYGDAAQAQQAEESIRKSVRMLDVLGMVLGGLRLQGFDTKLDAQDVHCSFVLEAPALRALLDLAPRFLSSMEP